MMRRLVIFSFALIMLVQHSPQASAQGYAWLENKDDKEGLTKDKGEWIRLADYDLSAEGMARLSTRKGVIALDIGYFPDAVRVDSSALSKIGDFKELQGLNVYVTGVDESDWSFLAKLSKLEALSINGEQLNLGDDFLGLISKLTSLESLAVRYEKSSFSDDGVSQLSSLKNLKELDLYLPSSSVSDWSFLAKLSKLENLRIGGGKQLNLGDDFLGCISKLKSLKRLEVFSEGSFSDDGVSQLSSLHHLTELHLSSSLLTDESLKTIGELEKLRTLVLTSPRLSKDAGSRLPNASKFKEIWIRNH